MLMQAQFRQSLNWAFLIKVVRGASGDAARAAKAFLDGTLSDSGAGCAEHGEAGHDCSR